MNRGYLLSPGPTPVPEEALLEMAKPLFHHRTPRFKGVFKEAIAGLQFVFQTKNDVFIFASSGTGAMEAAVSNTLEANEKVLVVQGGKFGERWGEICAIFGIETELLDVEWGSAVEPEAIRRALAADPSIKAVFLTQCETSTAVGTDIAAIGQIVRKTDALLAVDGISSVGAVEMRTDEWGVDLLAVGSQKALMLPPGLSFLAVSPKAWKKIEAIKPRAYYFNLKKARKSLAKWDTPYTPPITFILALNKTLAMIRSEGLEKIWRRHSLLARATRAAAKALGLALFSKSPIEAVTAIVLPEGLDGKKVPGIMRDEYGVTVAGGQGPLVGKIIRIAHMGYMSEFDTLVAISALEMALSQLGADVPVGNGIAAAQKVFLEAKKGE